MCTETKTKPMSNEELRSGNMENIVQAVAHEADPQKTYNAIGKGVVGTYEKIQDGVVNAYQKVEDAVVGAYKKVEDHFVGKFFAKDGETVEDAKERLKKQ